LEVAMTMSSKCFFDSFFPQPGASKVRFAEIKSRVTANFVGWEKDNALFDRELEKVIRE
jgi:hypothetical protein